jgi:hypothetical protein
LKLAQFVRVVVELFQMLSALLYRARGEVVFADSDDARDDRDDLCDVLPKGRRRSRTTDPVDDVLDGHYDGVGLGFEIRLERRDQQRIKPSTMPTCRTFNSLHASSGAS